MATSRTPAKDKQPDEGTSATQESSAPVTTGDPGTPGPLQSPANPTGDPNVSTGPVGDAQVIDAQEHVLGDDPRRVQAQLAGGYHDSVSGRPVDAEGNYTDGQTVGEGPVEPHRIVANDWPATRERINDPAKREGNEAADA